MAMKTYIVGGAVRDFLLGRPVKDFDFVVTGATPEDMLAQGFTQVGADFPVFLHPETKDEYALARTERKTAAGYHGFEVRFDPSVTIEEDLSRRDLTINAMAVAVEDWETFKFTLDAQLVVDPFHGWDDLLQHRLNVVSDAFAEDPVRILRTARFQARYSFAQTRETTRAVMAMVNAGEADALVPERVWAETWKAISERDPMDFFFFLEFHDVRAKLFKRLKLTDALLFDFDNTEFLARAQRMALLTVRFKNDNQVGLFFDELKAPKDVRDLAVATHKLAKLANTDKELDPEVIVDTLQDVGAFGNSARNAAEGLKVAARMHTDFVAKSHAFNVQRLQALLPKLAHVSFASLTDEQQATLKGADIGKALRDLRVDMVRNG